MLDLGGFNCLLTLELVRVNISRMPKGLRVLEELSKWGISLEGLVETAMQMYIFDPSFGDIRPEVEAEILRALQDPNVESLLLAALCLEEKAQKGEIESLKLRYKDDPVELLADEILGLQIAQYIGGTRALFEFYRFDRKKPGIMSSLPPFLDDAIGGLLAGVLVKVCSP